MDGRFLRIAVKDAAANRRIVQALRAVLHAPTTEAPPPVEAAVLFKKRPPIVAPPDSAPAGLPMSPDAQPSDPAPAIEP